MKRFVILIIALGLVVTACGSGDEDENKVRHVSPRGVVEEVIVEGKIVQVRFVEPSGKNDPTSDTLIQVVDSKGKNHYLAMSGKLDIFHQGQTLRATYKLIHLYTVYSDGTDKFWITRKPETRSTTEAHRNEDGSTSLVKIEWIFVDAENMKILSS